MHHQRSHFIPGLILAPLVLVLVTFGMSCSKKSPTAPSLPPDDVNALPEVPQPSAPNLTPPEYSASTLVLRPYTGDFNPIVRALKGSWKLFVRQSRWAPPIPGKVPPCDGDWALAYEGQCCCHEIPDVTVTVPGCGLLGSLTHTFWGSPTKVAVDHIQTRRALMVNGRLEVPPRTSHEWKMEECLTGVWPVCLDQVTWGYRWEVTGRRLLDAPYLLRERFWERVPMDDQGLAAVWLVGDNTFDITTTYRAGSDSATTNSFAKSLKVGAEGTFDFLKLSVEATIQKTYSTSVTISASQERSYQKHLVGDAGKVTCHTLWSLVDQYRWADAGKSQFTDPNYQFVFGRLDPRGRPVEFEIRGQQLVLMKTVFDQAGAVERSELIAVR